MKTHSILKIASLTAVFFTAMAFSCQDHNLPDPEPNLNCNLLDGSQRAFPCEFEITKIEFLEKGTNKVMDTATQNDSAVTLSAKGAQFFAIWSMQSYFDSFWAVRVTVKRIANAPSPSTYLTRFVIRDYLDYVYDPITPTDDQNEKFPINIAIGESFSFESGITMAGGVVQQNYPNSIYRTSSGYSVLVQNYETSQLLKKPPYNYLSYRDLAEAKIKFNPTIID